MVRKLGLGGSGAVRWQHGGRDGNVGWQNWTAWMIVVREVELQRDATRMWLRQEVKRVLLKR